MLCVEKNKIKGIGATYGGFPLSACLVRYKKRSGNPLVEIPARIGKTDFADQQPQPEPELQPQEGPQVEPQLDVPVMGVSESTLKPEPMEYVT